MGSMVLGRALVALAVSGAPVAAQVLDAVWTRQLPQGQPGLQAKLLDEGGAAWVAPVLGTGTQLQLSSFAGPGDAPLVEQPFDAGGVPARLATAARGGVAALLAWPQGAAAPQLEFRRLGQALPSATWSMPLAPLASATLGVHCLDDGSAAIVWVRDATPSLTRVWRVRADGTTAWTATATTDGSNPVVKCTGDGTRVVVVGGLRATTLDGNSGAQLYSALDFLQTSVASPALHALSRDGRAQALGKTDGAAAVWQQQGATWTKSILPAAPGEMLSAVAADPEGLRVALCGAPPGDASRVRLRIYERASSSTTSWSLVHEHVEQAPAGDSVGAAGLVFLEHGSALVCGFGFGLEHAGLADLRLVRRVAGAWSAAGGADLPGTLVALAGWDDGVRVLALRNDPAAGALTLALHASTPVDLSVAGVPRSGAQVQLEVRTDPGRLVRLYRAPRGPALPLLLGAVGELRLERTSLATAASAVADAAGSARASLSIPLDTSLVGSSIVLQGLVVGPRRLTRDWARLTVLP